MWPRIREASRHPFWQAVALMVGAYLLFELGVPWIPRLIGMKSAPVPNTVLLQYMATALVGVLIYVSDNEDRWRRFKMPISAAMVEPDKKWVRGSLLVLLPVLVGFVTWQRVRPRVELGAQLRNIHPAPPSSINFRGKSITLAGLENPLRTQGSMEEHIATGRRVYYENCVPCHGDRFDGQGHFAGAFSPAPLPFNDPGTIAQLTESFVFWRIAKGGPGLPREATPWNSAMPAWEDFLTEEEIWAVIIYLYEHTGWRPRTWEHEGSEAGESEPEATTTPPQTPSAEGGQAVYNKWCAGCHGDQGRGDGPASRYLLPKPRDFTRALYQVRSTATGEVPLAADIHRVVDEGMPGTSMPGWSSVLSGGERDDVVEYVRTFSSAFATAPTALEFGSSPGGGQAAVDSGRALYRKIECFKCHGQEGRGNGQSSPTLKDDFNYPIRAADLTRNWTFNGGSDVEDIYQRLRTGLDGTPMPSFSDLIDGNIITDDDLWRVAAYVRSLSPEDAPRVRDVVRADRAGGDLPTGPGDSAWAGVERFYLPLVGQVIARPRQFSPTVNGVFVQALHDGSRLTVRVSWTDPSQSPDTSWNVWRGRMARSMADDSVPWDSTSALPDQLAIQFPLSIPGGMDRPYFLMGSAEKPVYLWNWKSEPQGAVEALARGVDRVEPLNGQSDTLTASASYEGGEWRVQFTRALVTSDTTGRLQFARGRVIPMAVIAWDGSNNEAGARAAVASWNAIYLAEPAGAATVVSPVVAILLTLGVLMMIVRQAQKTSAQRIEPGVAEAL